MFETQLVRNLINRRPNHAPAEHVVNDARLIALVNEARTETERNALGRAARKRARVMRRRP
jgi:hypothetical protein